VQGVGSAFFDYKFACGDHSLQNFMNGIFPMRIISIRPNPAQEEITVVVYSGADSQSASKASPPGGLRVRPTAVSLFDAMGREVYSEMQNLSSGRNDIRLDTKNLSGGVYLLRIGNASQSFVKAE